jgi:hypothetical protein
MLWPVSRGGGGIVFAGAVSLFSLEKMDLVWFVKFVGRECGWE